MNRGRTQTQALVSGKGAQLLLSEAMPSDDPCAILAPCGTAVREEYACTRCTRSMSVPAPPTSFLNELIQPRLT